METTFKIIGMAILATFYAIYFGKMAAQRRRGIRTDQMARGRKPAAMMATELTMKVATYAVVVAQVVSIALGTAPAWLWIRVAGAIASAAGVTLFGVAVAAMRDSWRAGIPESDSTELVTTGIFAVSRNPAFLGFDLLYAGLAAMFFNPVLAVFSLASGVMLHLQILQEEKFLAATFGEAYSRYAARTGRYLGRRMD